MSHGKKGRRSVPLCVPPLFFQLIDGLGSDRHGLPRKFAGFPFCRRFRVDVVREINRETRHLQTRLVELASELVHRREFITHILYLPKGQPRALLRAASGQVSAPCACPQGQLSTSSVEPESRGASVRAPSWRQTLLQHAAYTPLPDFRAPARLHRKNSIPPQGG